MVLSENWWLLNDKLNWYVLILISLNWWLSLCLTVALLLHLLDEVLNIVELEFAHLVGPVQLWKHLPHSRHLFLSFLLNAVNLFIQLCQQFDDHVLLALHLFHLLDLLLLFIDVVLQHLLTQQSLVLGHPLVLIDLNVVCDIAQTGRHIWVVLPHLNGKASDLWL